MQHTSIQKNAGAYRPRRSEGSHTTQCVYVSAPPFRKPVIASQRVYGMGGGCNSIVSHRTRLARGE